MATAATARIELRVTPEIKGRIEHAAALDATSVSAFVVEAAASRADDVLRQHGTSTVVPADFFDQLIAALDDAVVADDATVEAIRRSRARGAQL